MNWILILGMSWVRQLSALRPGLDKTFIFFFLPSPSPRYCKWTRGSQSVWVRTQTLWQNNTASGYWGVISLGFPQCGPTLFQRDTNRTGATGGGFTGAWIGSGISAAFQASHQSLADSGWPIILIPKVIKYLHPRVVQFPCYVHQLN